MQRYAKVEALADGRFAPLLKVKSLGRVELGTYDTARLAAVAYDVARLVFINEKRPSTNLSMDQGTHHPADGYLCDDVFKALLANGTSFDDVCGLLRSGALADQFLCAQDRQTRHTGSNESGERPAASRQVSQPKERPTQGRSLAKEELQACQAPPPPQQQQQQQQQQQPGPLPSTSSPQAPAPAAAAPAAMPGEPGSGKKVGSPSPGKKKPMRWLEWPTKGGGQFVSCLSDRALKANMTLPARMKRELFQTSEATAEVAAHDLQHGSALRWGWEVRDYVKDDRTSTYIHGLAPFFKHYNASAGDVMVVVASAPGAVKTTIWRSDSPDAQQFKAFLETQSSKQGGGTAGVGSKKRPAEAVPLQQAPAKVPRPAPAPSVEAALKPAAPRGGNAAARAAGSGQQQASFTRDVPHPPSRSGSGLPHVQKEQQNALPPHPPQQQQQQQQPKQAAVVEASKPAKPHASQQPSPPVPPQAQARVLSGELLAMADAGIDASRPSGGEDDILQLSPSGQVAQSPYRSQPLQPGASATVPIKQEEQPSPPLQQEQSPSGAGGAGGAPAAAARAEGGDVGNAAAAAVAHSPARMSCADASLGLACQQQAAPGAQLAAPEVAAAQQTGSKGADIRDLLPDAMVLASDEAGVYVAMSRLLSLIAATGRVPADAVSAYRRSFGQLEPSGRRWFHYDSLKQLYDAAEWADLRQWLKAA